MDILYGIDTIVLQEVDIATHDLKPDGQMFISNCPESVKISPLISDGETVVYRSQQNVVEGVNKTPNLIYGYTLVFLENAFYNEEYAMLCGGTYNIDDYSMPLMKEGFKGKPFRMKIYCNRYIRDSKDGFLVITFNLCFSNFPGLDLKKDFTSPEFEITAMEPIMLGLPIKSIAKSNIVIEKIGRGVFI